MSVHLGRSWMGHPLEDECPCRQQKCGLIDELDIEPGCDQHATTFSKTMRQFHRDRDCPGA